MSNTLPSKHLKYLHLIKQLKLFDDDFMTLALRDNNEFHDEGYIIYVNGENEDDTPLGRLMHDFKCTNPNDMYYDLLRERVKQFKEDKRGVEEMCKIWDDIKKEGIQEGKLESYRQLYNDGVITKEQFEFYINSIQTTTPALAI